MPTTLLTVPLDGWFLAYRPRLSDGHSRSLPSRLLHHADFFNTARRNFLCPRFDEDFFAAGGEMQEWPAVPGVGYRVMKGQRIRIEAMFHNPTETAFPEVYLEVRIAYRLAEDGALCNVYPAWLSVTRCQDMAYDLPPGQSTTTARFVMSHAGRLIAVGGHLHGYARGLQVENATSQETIAMLEPRLNAESRMVSVPIVVWGDDRGYRLGRGDVVTVTATYDNPTSQLLPTAAMAVALAYFLPEDNVEFEAATGRR